MGYQLFSKKHKPQPKEEHPMQGEWDSIVEEQWKRSATKQAGDALISAFSQPHAHKFSAQMALMRRLEEEIKWNGTPMVMPNSEISEHTGQSYDPTWGIKIKR